VLTESTAAYRGARNQAQLLERPLSLPALVTLPTKDSDQDLRDWRIDLTDALTSSAHTCAARHASFGLSGSDSARDATDSRSRIASRSAPADQSLPTAIGDEPIWRGHSRSAFAASPDRRTRCAISPAAP